MPEKSQPMPEVAHSKEAWLKELTSKETRNLIFGHLLKMRLSPTDAEDLTQQTLLRATKAIETDKFRGESRMSSWLYTIAKNEALNFWRKNKKEPVSMSTHEKESDSAEDHLAVFASKEPTSEEKYIAESLKADFIKTNPQQQEVLRLFAEGLDNKQIAERTGINIGTVKSQISRAKKLLRKKIEGE